MNNKKYIIKLNHSFDRSTIEPRTEIYRVRRDFVKTRYRRKDVLRAIPIEMIYPEKRLCSRAHPLTKSFFVDEEKDIVFESEDYLNYEDVFQLYPEAFF